MSVRSNISSGIVAGCAKILQPASHVRTYPDRYFEIVYLNKTEEHRKLAKVSYRKIRSELQIIEKRYDFDSIERLIQLHKLV